MPITYAKHERIALEKHPDYTEKRTRPMKGVFAMLRNYKQATQSIHDALASIDSFRGKTGLASRDTTEQVFEQIRHALSAIHACLEEIHKREDS